MGVVSRDQLFKTPVITKIISELNTPDDYLQRLLGIQIGTKNKVIVDGTTASWDLFHNSRNIGTVSAPYSASNKRQRKPYGQRLANMVRMKEHMLFNDGDFERYRVPGGPVGSIDEYGMNHVKLQLSQFKKIFASTREWVLSRMLRGGFGMKVGSDATTYVLCEVDDASRIITVDSGLPAAHKAQLAVKSGGADAIDVSWADASADIINQMMDLDQYSARVSGRPIRHIILNSNTAGHLMKNTQLASVRGTANRLFDSMTGNPVSLNPDGSLPAPPTAYGYKMTFGAMPRHVFHIYDSGTTVPGTAEDFASQISGSNWSPFIPDGYAIFLPEPGDWVGLLEGTEIYRENIMSQPVKARGFTSWSRTVVDPVSGEEVHQLDNFLPVIYEPYAYYYAEVVFS